jgi:thiol-disulfide isomerase/thioredoxin
VLVNFWTYTCINSLRALPYVKGWAAKYQKSGVVVIGVHTPEFSFEKQQTNVEAALGNLHIAYPVVMDSNYRIWQGFNNQYWPAVYIIDAKGRIRYEHFGEGAYDDTEHVIQELLKENGPRTLTGISSTTPPTVSRRRPATTKDLLKATLDIVSLSAFHRRKGWITTSRESTVPPQRFV